MEKCWQKVINRSFCKSNDCSACVGFPPLLRWQLSWLLIKEILTKTCRGEKEEGGKGETYSNILLPDIEIPESGTYNSNPFLLAETWAWSSRYPKQGCLTFVALKFIISLPSTGNLWVRVLTCLWRTVGCSSCSKCLGWGDTYAYSWTGKEENTTVIISGSFLSSTVHPSHFSGLSGKICHRTWTISSARRLIVLCFLPSLHIPSSASDSSTVHGHDSSKHLLDVKRHCKRWSEWTHFSQSDLSQF